VRTTRLARLAADAEILLIRREIKTATRRAVYGAVAALFAVGFVVLLHVLGFLALEQFARFSPLVAAAIVLGVDLVLAGVFALLASGTMKDPVAAEARLIRDQSLAQIKETLTMGALLKPAGRLLGRKHIYGLVLAGLTARFLGGRA
jgi:archaellum biogenesis protein FlaJ (TadC family)